jgi:hypothetical protein
MEEDPGGSAVANESELVDYIRGFREPVLISVAAEELAMLGRSGAGWPQASATHWQRELEQLANKGLLNLCDGMLTVAKVETVKQQSLFDMQRV